MEHFVKLDRLPEGLSFPKSLMDRARYDEAGQRLVFDGFMSKSDFDRLYLLSDDWGYRRALEELFRRSTEETVTASQSVLGRLKGALAHLGLL